MSQILDSGERRQFDSGAVRDIQSGKGRCDLLPFSAINTYLSFTGHPCESDILGELRHVVQYDEHDKQFRVGAIIKAIAIFCELRKWSWQDCLLEVAKHFEEGANKYGERNWEKGISTHCYLDSGVRHFIKYSRGDDDEPHDRAFVWNMLCLIWTIQNRPECDDLA